MAGKSVRELELIIQTYDVAVLFFMSPTHIAWILEDDFTLRIVGVVGL